MIVDLGIMILSKLFLSAVIAAPSLGRFPGYRRRFVRGPV